THDLSTSLQRQRYSLIKEAAEIKGDCSNPTRSNLFLFVCSIACTVERSFKKKLAKAVKRKKYVAGFGLGRLT
ncbi:MAG: hypothetical protein M3275_16405, partial [Thermoproteota archaeon]|nr:hypothetical protein [Thermoproteota archaeon]